ncbi:protein WWC3-like isoform 2-T2 [Trichechus inunguis]
MSLAKVTDVFKNSCSLNVSPQDFASNPDVLGVSCLHQQFRDAGSQTDIISEFVFDDKTRLVDRVRLSKSERGRPGSSSWYSVKGNGFIPHMLPVSQDSTLNH